MAGSETRSCPRRLPGDSPRGSSRVKPGPAVNRRSAIVALPMIGAPLPDTSKHVANPAPVWLLEARRMGRLTTVIIEPRIVAPQDTIGDARIILERAFGTRKSSPPAPAREAYSHSASEGKRTARQVLLANRLQQRTASGQLTESTRDRQIPGIATGYRRGCLPRRCASGASPGKGARIVARGFRDPQNRTAFFAT